MGVDEVLAFPGITFAAFVGWIICKHDLDFEITAPMTICFITLSGVRLDIAIVATRSDLNILGLLHHLNAEPVRRNLGPFIAHRLHDTAIQLSKGAWQIEADVFGSRRGWSILAFATVALC